MNVQEREYFASAQNELTEHIVYNKLAQQEKNPIFHVSPWTT